MSTHGRFHLRCWLLSAGLLTGLVLTAPVPGAAQQVSLEGSWSGSGTVTFPSGNSEAARCKANFRRQGSESFAMNAVCATPSGKVAQTAQIDRVAGNKFSGEFHNPEYGVTGNISIMLRGNSLLASMNGGGATASFNLSK